MTSLTIPTYEHTLLSHLQTTLDFNRPAILTCAEAVAQVVKAHGVLHVFGSGHSSAVAFELFHRAGGLACVNLLANAAMSPFAGAQSRQLERLPGVADAVCAGHTFQSYDLGIVISNCGSNTVPLEMVQKMKTHGMKTIGVLSVPHAERLKRPVSLLDLCDFILDTRVPAGDVLLAAEAYDPYGPASTIVASALLNSVVCAAIELLRQENVPDIVLRSHNLPDAEDHNEKLRSYYRNRVRLY